MSSDIKHVAIIMDGNGRWANQRLHPRVWGHVRGSGVVSDIVQAADDNGIKALTLYAFSTENWARPQDEVGVLFKLLHKFLLKESKRLIANKVSFKVIGDVTRLPQATKNLINDLENETKSFPGLKLTFCFSYGARMEMVSAINKFISENPGKTITEDDLQSCFMRPETGDVDLLIRTGGEQRVSNFLLWQIAYAELYFTPTKWPDFTPSEFKRILESVSKRERRFGGLSASSNVNHPSIDRQLEVQSSHV
ncbi:MAG: di-trans,poly-cis-decaprenylcistransferase [Bacteriovoracaceae bacterium]|nr:di-trans,poly-cis-decaprenylcistransferase [Bacteriovoracaceae bacterium]